MKRILFCAGILALAASCTEDEFDSFATQNGQNQGITFTAEAPMTKIQWDETETSYVPFWYAEQDRIAIYGIGVLNNVDAAIPADPNKGDSWDEISTKVTYKATQSEKIGKFTATADGQTLYFNGGKEARFLGLYPSTVTAAWTDIDSEGNKGLKISSLPNLKTQEQTTTKGYNESVMMYSLSKASKVNDYDAVGENASLSFQRPFSALVLSTANANEYTNVKEPLFGVLEKVEVEAKGYSTTSGTDDIDASVLTIADEDYLVVDTLTNQSTFVAAASPATPRASKVSLTIGTGGLGWSDDALAVVAINDVDRSETFAKDDKDETIEITWTFANIVLKQSLKTQASWDGFVEAPKLDIADYDYLVTEDDQLLVLNGNFKDIFNEAGDKIVWDNGDVLVTDIKNIISKVALSDEELAMLKDFTALEKLTLAENTEIPANTFTTGQAGLITDLNLPKVTKVAQKFIENNATNAFSALENLAMPAYEFEDDVVNKAFFNSSVKATLESLDMSGVRSMLPQFGIERTLSFKGYAKLAEVTVQDGMIVSPSGFADCKLLATVNGAVDIASAPQAFSMDADKNNSLKSIKVSGTEIPAKAFYRCTALATVEYQGAQLAPTVVGERGLAATAIKYMDLSKLTSVGAAAFKQAQIISSNKNTTYLEVGATEIPEEAFAECKGLKMVKFTNATTITGNKVLEGATSLIQVKFLKAVSLGSGTDFANVFGKREGSIDLWVNPEQSGVNGLNWTLEYINGEDVKTVTYTFKSIQKKIED